LIGVDNVMFETDYPHQDGTFPHSRQMAEKLFRQLDEEWLPESCMEPST
jgi:hypothetical protein